MKSWQLVYRIVGDKEREAIVAQRESWFGKTTGQNRLDTTRAVEDGLRSMTESFMLGKDFGQTVFEHIQGAFDTGYIGGPQPLVSLFTDADKVIKTTDPQLKGILTNAKYMLTFQMPRGSFFEPPGDLSRLESEVLALNKPPAFMVMLVDHGPNPFRTSNTT